MEIKTVRIVKRESQLRQKDKTRRGLDETELTSVGETENQQCDGDSPEDVIEQDAVLSQFRRSLSLPRGYDRRSKTAQDAISRIPNFRHHMLKRMVDRVSDPSVCFSAGSWRLSTVFGVPSFACLCISFIVKYFFWLYV